MLLSMAPRIVDISGYTPKFTDTFFFDNNIWMFLFCPIGNHNQQKQRIYSAFLDILIQRKATIFVNSLVISEFTNASLRLDYNLWNRETGVNHDFKKDYVGSDRYSETVDEIKAALNNIFRLTQRVPDDFNAINISAIQEHLENIDFNDSYYIEQAAMKNWIIVTDDRDFRNYTEHNSTILTSV